MEYTIISILLFILTWFYFYRRQHLRVAARLPPGPYRFPVIGSIFKLGKKPHHSLAALSKTYGPLMSLKLGSTTAIVVSSREIAHEFFSKHDSSFSNRSISYAATTEDRHKASIAWMPVGDKWRMLRKISKETMFTISQLDASQIGRKKKVLQLLEYVQDCCDTGKAVNIGQTVFATTLNVLSNFVFSIDLAQYDSLSTQELKDFMWTLMEVLGSPDLANFFPFLGPLDLNGLRSRTTFYIKKVMAIYGQHISKRLQERSKCSSDASSSSKDVLDLLLDISQKDKSLLSLDDIQNLIFDMFLAGSDTTSTTLEWAMAELIHNPEKMSKARYELQVLGKEDRTVEESDISRLPYLQAVVKETLRLHPPVTFLIPHTAITDFDIQGYIIPKDAQILCNLWAMGQDPNVWSDAQAFQPERFLDAKIDYKGQDFEFIPFGAGRRMCPGLPLAHRMLHLMLGSLIYRFDWKIEGGGKSQDMDMTDKFGFALKKNVPLGAIPVKL